MHDNVHNCSMERALKSTNVVEKNAAMETARAAKTGIDKVNEELEYLQKRLMKYLNIRFFSGLFVRQAKTPRVPAI